jgi:SRSO17 transposase
MSKVYRDYDTTTSSQKISPIYRYLLYLKDLFTEVRAFEYFKYLHIGIMSDIKRKSLPEIAKVVGLENYQGLHHFLTASPWTDQ